MRRIEARFAAIEAHRAAFDAATAAHNCFRECRERMPDGLAPHVVTGYLTTLKWVGIVGDEVQYEPVQEPTCCFSRRMIEMEARDMPEAERAEFIAKHSKEFAKAKRRHARLRRKTGAAAAWRRLNAADRPAECAVLQ